MTAPEVDPWLWPTDLTRDPSPQPLCLCSHGRALHNIETVKAACSVSGCACDGWSHGSDRWRFVGYVDVKR